VSETRTVDNQTFAIGVLSVTACMLFVGIILLMQRPAAATSMNDRAGDYMMATQQYTTSAEAIVVIDAAAKQMNVYEYDYGARSLELLSRVPLDQMPKPGDRDKTPDQKPGQRRRPSQPKPLNQ
jgi:hypothetical protein